MKNDLKVIAINLTSKCNLKCMHCARKDDEQLQEELSISFFIDILKQATSLGTENVNITGGEIFLRKDCFELIENALSLGYFVGIESNGTLIKKEHVEKMSTYGKNFRISISLDGVTAEVHDAIRGKGSFSKTISALELLSQYNIPARVITVLNKNNMDQIPELVRYVTKELDLGFRLIPNIIEYGRGIYTHNEYGVNYLEVNKLLENFYFDFLREKNSEKFSVELSIALAPIDVDFHNNCQWGKAMIGISPYGTVNLCHVQGSDERFIFGDLKKNSLKDIWENSIILNRFRDMNPNNLKGICGNCLARDYCRGGCRLHAISKYNDFLAPDPQCQIVYNMGMFPEYAIDDLNRSSDYKEGV